VKQALWIGLLVILFIGCKQTPQEMVTGPRSSPAHDGKPTDTTQDVACTGKTPDDISVFGSWGADFSQGKGKLHQVFRIDKTSVTMNLTCTVGGNSVSVEVQVPADVSETEIRLLKTDTAQADFHEGSTAFRCSAELRNTENIKYSFSGACLHLKSDLRDAVFKTEK
jgi:hypothetical protein